MRSASRSALLVSLSALALGACSGGKSSDTIEYKTAAPTPPASITTTSVEPDSLLAGDIATPPLTASAGLTTDERLARLESSLDRLREDFNRVAPAFAGLKVPDVETEIVETTTVVTTDAAPAPLAMSTMPPAVISPVAPATGVLPPPGSVSTPPSDDVIKAMDAALATPLAPSTLEPAMTPAPVVAETTTTTTTTTSEITPASASVVASATGIRIGEHGTKTRMVIDLQSPLKPDMTQDIDNGEKLMLINLPSVTWAGAESGTPAQSAFISGWSAQKGASGGTTIAVQLKKEAKVLSSQYLKAEKGGPARLVLDIGSAS